MKTKIIPQTESAYDYPLLIKRILMSATRYEPDNEIVYRDRERYSYCTFQERVCRLANLLQEAGVEAGDTVAVLDWDSHRYLECYFAVPMIGAVLHHVNIRLSPEQIVYTMNHAEDKLVLVHEDFVPLLEQVQDKLETVQQYVLLAEQSVPETTLPLRGEYEKLMAQAGTTYDFPDFDENSVATTFYTTGTTGNPKGVYFTHRQLVLHTLNMVGAIGAYEGLPLMRSDDVYMPITPMFHVHAWGVPYVATMLGVKQVYPGRYEPDTLVNLQQQEKVTFSHCVPTILQMLLSCEAGSLATFEGWKVLIGGSALSQGLAAQAMERGIDIYSAYGMSETCPLLTVAHLNREMRSLPVEQQLKHRTRTGVASNMVDLRVVDPEGNAQPHDGQSVGEIVVRAPWLTQGYLKEAEKSRELWDGGWLHTGDVACIHENGFVEIKDRIKDVIKTGGEWISSLELENLISQHSGVASVAVVGVPDAEWGERPYAMVVPKADDQTLNTEIIQTHLMQYVDEGRINKWWIPERMDFVDDIPKTSVGKINKKVIREQVSH